MVLTLIYYFWSFMKKKDVSMNCLPLWILELLVFTLFMEVWNMQKKEVNGMLAKFLSVYLNILWTLLREGKPVKKSESDVYPLPYCGHRWCENENCLHRAVEIWPAFNTFVKLIMRLPRAKQLVKGEGKSFLVIKKAVDDPLIQPKMKFLELLSSKLNEFFREGIIQKKSSCGSRTLPLVIFAKKVPFFQKIVLF